MMTVPQALALAVQQHRAGQLPQAEEIYRAILRVDGQQADALHLLGVLALQVGQQAQAIDYISQAVRFRPAYAEAQNNLGLALQGQGRLKEALSHLRQAVQLQPAYAEAHNNLGNVLQEQGQLEAAVASYQEAVRLRPDFAEAHNNLGHALQQQGKPEEALARLRQAVRLRPDFTEAHNNLGNVLHEQGQQAEALTCYQQALRFRPDCAEAHKNRALAWLLAGDFKQGWPEYEWRWQCKELARPRFPQPRWDGTPLAGRTILLHAEQGLGDTLQFIRYAPLVQARGGRVLVSCQPALVPLLRSCRGIDELVGQGDPLLSFDVHAPLLSVPGILGTTLATIPAAVPYLFADASLSAPWREQRRGRTAFTIGIAWQGSPTYRGDRRRSIPLVHFAPLAQLPGVELVSLQKGPGTEQLRGVADRFAVTDLGSQLDATGGAFLETAAVMQHLDLVITSDTAIPHLAGALGVPVWVALPFVPDWRWLVHREDSPWYPSMRLFRQQEWGNWPEVFGRIATALRQRLCQRGLSQVDTRC